MKKLLWIAVFGVSLLPGSLLAKGVEVEPGLWEMTMTMQMPMMPTPQLRTSTECIEETELDPKTFQMEEDSPCKVGDVAVEGDTLSWAVDCPSEMGSMTGKWSVTSSGDSMRGEGSMSGDMGGGQKMVITMSWEGNRVGDCD
jgi:hypothetical protein